MQTSPCGPPQKHSGATSGGPGIRQIGRYCQLCRFISRIRVSTAANQDPAFRASGNAPRTAGLSVSLVRGGGGPGGGGPGAGSQPVQACDGTQICFRRCRKKPARGFEHRRMRCDGMSAETGPALCIPAQIAVNHHHAPPGAGISSSAKGDAPALRKVQHRVECRPLAGISLIGLFQPGIQPISRKARDSAVVTAVADQQQAHAPAFSFSPGAIERAGGTRHMRGPNQTGQRGQSKN